MKTAPLPPFGPWGPQSRACQLFLTPSTCLKFYFFCIFAFLHFVFSSVIDTPNVLYFFICITGVALQAPQTDGSTPREGSLC